MIGLYLSKPLLEDRGCCFLPPSELRYSMFRAKTECHCKNLGGYTLATQRPDASVSPTPEQRYSRHFCYPWLRQRQLRKTLQGHALGKQVALREGSSRA